MSILKGEAALARKLHAQKETTGRIITSPQNEAYAEGWERVFGHRCEICGKPAESITQFDHVIGETVHFAWGCKDWPRCG